MGIATISLWGVTALGSLWIRADVAGVAGVAGVNEERVWVTRTDQSRQCAPKSGIPLETARAALKQAGVKVLDGKRENDGKMRAKVCGGLTGFEHRFLIGSADLKKAESLGYAGENGDRIKGPKGVRGNGTP